MYLYVRYPQEVFMCVSLCKKVVFLVRVFRGANFDFYISSTVIFARAVFGEIFGKVILYTVRI